MNAIVEAWNELVDDFKKWSIWSVQECVDLRYVQYYVLLCA